MKTLRICIFLLSMMLTSFAWAYDFEKDGICYNILSEQDKTVEVAHDYYTYKGDVVIPSEVNGYSVVGIADHAFEGSFSLKSITIPKSILHIGNAFWATDSLSSIIVDKENPVFDSRDNCNAVIETASNRLVVGCRSTIIPNGITSIGKLAFQGCKIQSIELPNSLVRIEDEAFYSSTIKTISIPDNVTEIGESAFWYCDSLASIKLPLNLKTLGVGAFEDCYTLTSISIPDGVTEISDSLFCGCSNLKNVIMPNSVTSIGKCAFQGCYKIENISIPSETTIINDSAFYVCSNIKYLYIPNKVTVIGEKAFGYCRNLSYVVIPNSVEQIGSYPFRADNKLTDIYCFLDQPIMVGKGAFSNENKKRTIHVLKGKKEVFEQAETWGNYTIVDDLSPEDYTSVRAVASEKPNCTNVYTLDGVNVDGNNLRRGIYIKDGKKVMVK